MNPIGYGIVRVLSTTALGVGARLRGRLRCGEREFLEVGRQGDTNRLKELAGDAGGWGPQQEALAVLRKGDFLQPIEIAQDAAPFGGNPEPSEPVFEFFGEQQGEEGTEHVAADGGVAAVVDRTGGEHGLGLTQQLFDPQQVAVAQHDLQRRDFGIGAQYVETIKALVFGDPRLVDGKMLG